MTREHILRIGVVEKSDASANDRLLVTAYIPSDAHARRPIVVVRLIQAACAHNDIGARCRVKVCEAIVFFLDDPEIVVAEAKIHGEAVAPPIAVLHINCVRILKGIPVGVSRILKPAGRGARKKTSQTAEMNSTAEIDIKNLPKGSAAEFVAEFDIVLAALPGNVVDVVPIGIHAVAEIGRTGAELR